MIVLAVDDNDQNLRILEAMLAIVGVGLIKAVDAEQAFDLLVPGCAFDAVLMDLRMPKVDGLEATRTIRARLDETAAVPIAILTADASPELEAQSLAAGANCLLHKPLEMNDLTDTLAKLILAGQGEDAVIA